MEQRRLKPRELETVGQALFGERWQTPMAEALKVADRTVRRWLAGDVEPPVGIVDDLLQVARARAAKVGHAVALLEQLRGASD